ncbi:MAG: hypothetical protein MUF15_10705 [Acidobacteria bacterium]|jgi:hypothetical protein|nr:hypothetical protein [Acidobacteriota bacterium]
MPFIFLNPNEQGLVVFKIWKSLHYKNRLLISTALILGGFFIQYFMFALFPGVLLLLAGNLLLLPAGITHLKDIGVFNAESGWEKVEKHKLDEYLDLDRKIKKWDRSTIDISNGLGGFIFVLLLIIFSIMTIIAFIDRNTILTIIGADAIVLLLPYWLTGLRSIFRDSQLTMKVKLVKELIARMETPLQTHKVDYYFLMRGKDKHIPMDIKFRVNIAGQHKDFLGFYGQITINGQSGGAVYPYFYVVLVARKGYGFTNIYRRLPNNIKLKKEFKEQDDVEVIVIRQNTDTVSMGYRTTTKQAEAIFLEGLALAEQVAPPSVGDLL